MKNNLFNDALDQISDEFIADAKVFSARRLYLKIVSVAACVVLVVATIPAVHFLTHNNHNAISTNSNTEVSSTESESFKTESSDVLSDSGNHDVSETNPQNSSSEQISSGELTHKYAIPVYDSAFFSASDIVGTSVANKSGSNTNSYTKVYVPDVKYLSISPLPTDPYVTIYERKETKGNIGETELRATAEEILPKFQMRFREIFSERYIDIDSSNKYWYYAKSERYLVSIAQSYDYSFYSFSAIQKSIDTVSNVYLDGEVISIDQTKTDDEILASLSSIKQKLFDIFGVSFKYSKITRKYNGYSTNGESTITIRFYNEENSDNIELYFDNQSHHKDDVVSATDLYEVEIFCRKYNPNSVNIPIAKVKLISVAEAEKLLRKGYVFGGYSCPLCMSEQDHVDFSDYNYVDIEYITARYTDKTRSFPYYAFYKHIGNAENGNMIFAKTYVPAIAVTDLDQYFAEKHSKH